MIFNTFNPSKNYYFGQTLLVPWYSRLREFDNDDAGDNDITNGLLLSKSLEI